MYVELGINNFIDFKCMFYKFVNNFLFLSNWFY